MSYCVYACRGQQHLKEISKPPTSGVVQRYAAKRCFLLIFSACVVIFAHYPKTSPWKHLSWSSPPQLALFQHIAVGLSNHLPQFINKTPRYLNLQP